MSFQIYFHLFMFYTTATFFLTCATTDISHGQGNWSFHVKWEDGNIKLFQYPESNYSNCLYYKTEEFLLCENVRSFQDVVSNLTSNPGLIQYVSVECFPPKSKAQNERFCFCQRENPSSSKRCQIDRLTPKLFRDYSGLEVLDLSNNLISFVHPLLFENLTSLRVISLHHNPLSTLSSQPPCFPHGLQFLDLSYSKLKYFPRFYLCGEEKNDPLPVFYLDLSHTHLREISEKSFEKFGNLKFINLSGNFLSQLPPTLFNGFLSLTSVDLSSNQIQTITNRVCDRGSKIERISLASNTIFSLDLKLFTECSVLEMLDLSNNGIQNLSGFPLNLHYLKTLNMSGNLLTNLTDSMFSSTSGLEVIDLSDNDITFISGEVFDNGIQMETLILRNNLLNGSQPTPADMTSRCRNMRHLDMSFNMMTSLDSSFLSHLSLLNYLDLSFNRILTIHNDAFVGLRSLTYLNLAHNLIENFDFTCIYGLLNLTHFNISHNNVNNVILDHLPPSLFSADLSRNRLTSLTQLNSSTLKHFSISRNSLVRISRDDLADCRNLISFDSSHNLLVDVDPFAFENNELLETLDLSHNRIVFLPNSTLSSLPHLKRLDLSYNQLLSLSSLHIPESLKMLHVSHNPLVSLTHPVFTTTSSSYQLQKLDMQSCDITFVAHDAFAHLNSLRTVDLRKNNIANFTQFTGGPETVFDLRDNPLECTCSMAWLKQQDGGSLEPKDDSNYSIDFCAVPPKYHIMPFKNVTKEAFLCQIYEKCPDSCVCFAQTRNAPPEFIMCSKQNLISVPYNISSHARVIALDGNNLQELESISEMDLSVQELYLNSSRVSKLSDKIFFGMPEIKILDLSGNNLTSVQTSWFSPLQNLTVLNISNNKINILPKNVVENLDNLQILDVSANNLHNVDKNFFLSIIRQQIEKVYLAGNPWSCDCKNENLIKWIQKHLDERQQTKTQRETTESAQVPHRQHQHIIIQDFMSVLCDKQSQMVYLDLQELDCDGENFRTKMSILIACIVAFIISCFIFFCIYHRKLITAVLYSRLNCVFLKRVPAFNRQLLLSAPFDITVVYDFSDRKLQWWVDSILVPKLHQPKWRFSIKYPQKETMEHGLSLMDMSIHNVNRSRCSLVVATPTFGSNRQCVSCFQQALKQRRKCLHSIVVITWGELTRDTLETGIRSFVSKGLNLPITSRFFWDKLIYQLPLPRHSEPSSLNSIFRNLKSPTQKNNSTAQENNDKSNTC